MPRADRHKWLQLLLHKGGVKPLHLGLGVAAFVTVAVVVEVFFHEPKERLMGRAFLPGLGWFAWVFLVLVFSLEWIRNFLGRELAATSDAVRDAAGAADDERLDRLHSLYREECRDDPVLDAQVPDVTSFTARAARDPSFVPKFLARRSERLSALVEHYYAEGAGCAGQLGLFGTCLGLIGALELRAQTAKDMTLAAAASVNSLVATALSTTGCGSAIVLLTMGFALLLRAKAAKLRRQVNSLLATVAEDGSFSEPPETPSAAAGRALAETITTPDRVAEWSTP